MAPTRTTVLISGANRGLGLGLLTIYLARPSHTIVALVRDPEHATSRALADLPAATDSRLVVIRADAAGEHDAETAVQEMQKQGIDHVDIAIAGAAIYNAWPSVAELKIADLRGHMETNVYGVVRLYQAVLPLMLQAVEPKWVTMGSSSGWIENQYPVPNAAYGPTKAAIHWLTKRMNGEQDKLTAFVADPGLVRTEMGNNAARTYGYEQAPQSVEESCEGVVALIDKATKEATGGKLWGYDGKQQAW